MLPCDLIQANICKPFTDCLAPMLRFVSLMETYLCSVSSFIRKLNAADPELRLICSLQDLNITQSMDTLLVEPG